MARGEPIGVERGLDVVAHRRELSTDGTVGELHAGGLQVNQRPLADGVDAGLAGHARIGVHPRGGDLPERGADQSLGVGVGPDVRGHDRRGGVGFAVHNHAHG